MLSQKIVCFSFNTNARRTESLLLFVHESGSYQLQPGSGSLSKAKQGQTVHKTDLIGKKDIDMNKIKSTET